MCGIVGYFGFKDVDLRLAAEAILHRGPDMQGISSGTGWRIAFNRLAIIDTSENGMQPFTCDGVTVMMNGEIYNYRELKDEHRHEYCCRSGSDVEILPFLYKKYGIGFLQKLNGMFAMALIDERASRYFLIRDRFGKKPLFYRTESSCVYFGSELKALGRLVNLQPDRTNLALNMTCWMLVQPLTPYEGVFNINPGHYLEFDGSMTAEKQWYRPQVASREQSWDEISEKFLASFKQSIHLRLRSDVPVGICLSGGLDSSAIAYFARSVTAENLVAFTANIVGKDRWEGTTDTENPAQLCRDLQMRQVCTTVDADYWNRHIVDIARNYDEIFLNSGTLVFYAISAAAQEQGVKVLLSGAGGDELFGGYPWQARMRSLPLSYLRRCIRGRSSGAAERIHQILAASVPGRIPARVARAYRLFAQFQVWHAQSLSGMFGPYMADTDRAVADRIQDFSEHYFRISADAIDGDPYNQVHYANMFTVIGNGNYQLDMASMRNSVENRSPLLDYKVVEYLMSVPDRLKNADGPKSLFRSILAPFVPAYITKAGKSGPTMPLDQWYGSDAYGNRAKSFIVDNRHLVGDLLSADLAARVQDDALYAGKDGALRMFALISFVLWAKINVERSLPSGACSFGELTGASSRTARAASGEALAL
jgi:asparagine synthase (glutamine-hydrolysing)